MSSDNINLYSKEQTDALLADKADTDDLATVALTGSYNDLTDKPTIPEVVLYPSTGQNTDGAMTQKAVTDELDLKADSADLATVATSGSYNDLSDKPTIPSAAILYPGTGQNTDGAMTQKAVTDALPSADELVPDYTGAAEGTVLTIGANGPIWASPGASIGITDMGTYYRITY